MNCKMYFYLPREHGNKYLSTSYPARLSFSFSKLQFWNIIYDFIHRGQLDVGGRRCWTSLRHGGEAVVGGGGRGTDLWSWCSLRLSCAPLGIPGPACSGPTGPGPPPSPTLPSAFPQREILSPPQGLTALDRGGEFGFCDLTADSEHSLQRRSSQSRFSLSLSLCGPSGSWSIYTKLQASKENLQPYHGIKGAVGWRWWGGESGWNVCLSSSFSKGDFWLHVGGWLFSLSSSAWSSSLKFFCHVYWDNEDLFFYFYSNINVRKWFL